MRLADRPTSSLPFPSDGAIHWNLSSPELVEHAIRLQEGALAQGGPLVTITAPYTGRSPNDKFVVREPRTESEILVG
jgi:phosphoenolpyruvate carboxykinase (ATP)